MANTTETTTEELRVPEVGESISEVVIGVWHKQVGDSVERDEEIVELESEKATFEAPSPVSGVISEILKQPGDTAEVGEVIAYIESGGNGQPTPRKRPQATAESAPPAPPVEKQPEAEESSAPPAPPPRSEPQPRTCARTALPP